VKISKGDVLFTISGAQLAEGNSELNFRQVTADLDRASANYERAKKLIADKIITEGDFLDAKNEYEKLLNTYENLSATQGKNGNIVTAGVNGYIKEVYVTEGEKVSPGEQLASLVIDHNLVLRADVSPDKSEMLNKITDANFKVGYSDKVYRLSEMNGSKISQGKSTGANSYYIPVFFRMDYTPELIEGTFAEVYLIGSEMSSAIVVPNSALMEEFGKMYVFIADPDGEFLKRYVVTGNSDGQQTEIISGLSEGESIVAEGTYRVKLMQQNTNPPSHNH
jgi:RND family efflux transporter MFP subunit